MREKDFFSGIVKKRAVAYYRHSAEDKQENSVPIQREQIEKFAFENGVEIIHEEADEGVTGLLANRPGFQRLLNEWVFNESAPPFEYILVLDVSRWGRFHRDESAYYQYLCSRHGKEVVYMTQGFPKPGDKMSRGLMTAMEREMAAHYSEILSEKVSYGSMRVSQQGYSVGGIACYGMGRELLDVHRNPVRILKKGEHKQVANERVRFVPLNDETTDAVRHIFQSFVEGKKDFYEIAAALNRRGTLSATGGKWNREKIIKILTNETYAGTRIYNKTWRKLKQPLRKNPRSEWVICRDAFPGIVNRSLFEQAQERLWFEMEKWREGEWAIQRAKALFRRRMKVFLRNKGFGEDDVFYISYDFPLVFSVSMRPSESAEEWCFVLPENMGWHRAVLGIGVVPEHTNPVDRFFLIPTEDFCIGRVCTFTNKDQRYERYALKSEELEQTVLSLVESDFITHDRKEEISVPV
jgi:DNA invertase Pin-like site-specific DNA recombinase